MNNQTIAQVFNNIAELLELKGEIIFKIRAYQKAARAIEHLPVEVERLLDEERLQEIPGVGDAISRKIHELVTTGRLEYYDKLRAEFPEGIGGLLDVPGIGPKTAMRLIKEISVTNTSELETALRDGRVATMPRMGEKTVENLQRNLEAVRRKDTRILLGEALPVAEELLALLKQMPGLANVSPAGSLRRFRETVGDIDIIGTADDPEAVLEKFVRLPQVTQVLGQGATKAAVIVHGALQVDFRIVEHASYGSLLQHLTGSKEHNVILRERAVRRGLHLSEYGITNDATGELERFLTEESFYGRMGLQYMPPELREAGDEIERAEADAIPTLVELADIRGDLHAHTDGSDGNNSLEEMAQAAAQRGYQYLAITDHSVGRGIAHGLSVERLHKQVARIRELDGKFDGLRLLAGSEVDIRSDGSLDYPDEVLAELDVVVASVHSAMGQDQAKMTQRIIAAMRNPYVDIIGHPSCRLLGMREPVAVDWEAVFRAAAATGTALEINAMPTRLDLKDIHVMRARELGVKLVIATDAHAPDHLDFMRFGVGVARRGWCEAKHILNTQTLDALVASLKSGGRKS